VITSQPGVEACLLESPEGLAITLLNWTGQPIRELRVTIPTKDTFHTADGIEAGALQPTQTDQGVQLVLPLDSADVLLLEQ
jgi:hypothetical protein